MNILCHCGSPAVAIRPGADPEFGHPPDMFGLPDLRQKPVVMIAEIPDEGWCAEHWSASWARIERGVAHV